jgi:hypothetical protein
MHRSPEHAIAPSGAPHAKMSYPRVTLEVSPQGERAAESCSLMAARVALPHARPI